MPIRTNMSRVPQGTCGLKCELPAVHGEYQRRVPQGTCGLKSDKTKYRILRSQSGPARDLWIEIARTSTTARKNMSGPARDLWIEIKIVELARLFGTSRVPQGTCGLKLFSWLAPPNCPCRRVPQGTCGLKFSGCQSCRAGQTSGPARDLWIEIAQ